MEAIISSTSEIGFWIKYALNPHLATLCDVALSDELRPLGGNWSVWEVRGRPVSRSEARLSLLDPRVADSENPGSGGSSQALLRASSVSPRLGSRSVRLGSARLGSARLCPVRLGSARLGSARLGPAHQCWCQTPVSAPDSS